jgi:RNA polymerase sigma-70 factor (ECF subfamily)
MGLFRLGGKHQVVTFEQFGDEELVEHFRQGEAAAFSELFRRHHQPVARLIARMLGTYGRGGAELEDLVQDVFVQIYRSLDSFRGQSRLGTWIYRIAVNVVLMHRRSARSRPTFVGADQTPIAADPGPLPDANLVQKRNIEALYRHLGQLSEKKRTVFILHEIEGLSPQEIAQIVAAPVLTVRTRLFYARRELLASFREDPALASLALEYESADKSVDSSESTVRLRATSPASAEIAREKLS